MLNAITNGRCKDNGITQKSIAVRLGNSVLWLDPDSNPDLDILPQKEDIKHRHRELVRSGHDKQVRPRRQNKKHDYDCEPA